MTTTDEAAEPEPVPIHPLVAQVMWASMGHTQSMTEMVMQDYKNTVARLEAKLWLIQENVHDLCTRGYVPNPAQIIDALYPTDELIDATVQDQGAAS